VIEQVKSSVPRSMASLHSRCVIRTSKELLLADVPPTAENGRHSTVRNARFKLISVRAFRQKGVRHGPTILDWSIRVEVQRHPGTALYGPDRTFRDVSLEVAHVSDVRLDLECLSSAIPRVRVDVVERSYLARV